MTSHLDLANKEDEYAELVRQNIARDAAILIIDGYETAAAIEKAKEIAHEQAMAANDITGVHETLEEAQSPSAANKKEKQIIAIQRRLLEEEDI